jgi:hypothetical protein
MNRTLIPSLAAATALSLTALAYGVPPDPNAPSATSAPSPTQQTASPQASGAGNAGSALERLLPQGMSAQQACGGFSSAGDCALVLHVAQNLNVSFADLKSKLAGGQSLTAAISEMKPGADPQAEVNKAETQARSDLGGGQ